MSGLPTVSCPVCNAAASLDVLLGHQGARDALIALAGLHKSQRLQLTALRYVGLFAPAKQTMRFDRVADVLAELHTLMATGQVKHKGRTYAAPLEYWINAMDDMLARRTELQLPMASHNYLVAIVAGYSDKAESASERSRQQLAAGATPPVGYAAPATAAPAAAASKPAAPRPAEKKGIPDEVSAYLGKFASKKGSQHENP